MVLSDQFSDKNWNFSQKIVFLQNRNKSLVSKKKCRKGFEKIRKRAFPQNHFFAHLLSKLLEDLSDT